jgi:hypothetical protein
MRSLRRSSAWRRIGRNRRRRWQPPQLLTVRRKTIETLRDRTASRGLTVRAVFCAGALRISSAIPDCGSSPRWEPRQLPSVNPVMLPSDALGPRQQRHQRKCGACQNHVWLQGDKFGAASACRRSGSGPGYRLLIGMSRSGTVELKTAEAHDGVDGCAKRTRSSRALTTWSNEATPSKRPGYPRG